MSVQKSTTFRPEVMARNEETSGKVLLVRPVSFTVIVLLALTCASVLIAFATIAVYTKHVTLPGVIVSENGLVNVVSPHPGQIVEIRARNGEHASSGNLLFVIKTEDSSKLSGGAGAEHAQMVAGKASASTDDIALKPSNTIVRVMAPVSGTVGSVLARTGDYVTQQRLGTIVPTDVTFSAVLYASNELIGTLHEGQVIILRFESFPYQRFGQYQARIRSISSTPVTGQQIVAAGNGMTKIEATESYYPINADLYEQSVSDGRKLYPLKTGMRVDVSVATESRTIMRWMFGGI